jgi:hypothetical protein
MDDVLRDIKRILSDVKQITRLAIETYDRVERTIEEYRNASGKKERDSIHKELEIKLDLFLQRIEDLEDDELRTISKQGLPEFNRKIVEEILALKEALKKIDDYFKQRNYEKVKEELAGIIDLARAEFKEEKGKKKWYKTICKAPLYNGTCLAIVFAILNFNNGIFREKEAFFYVDPQDAAYYTSCPEEHVKQIFKSYGGNFDDLGETRKSLMQGFTLEFDHDKVGEAHFKGIEEGRAEFVVERTVSLKSLTPACKKKLAKALDLPKDSEQYKLLFG